MEKVVIKSEYITLGQFLKFVGIIDCGSYAKEYLLNHKTFVNGVSDQRRGRKIYPGDLVKIEKKEFEVEKVVD